LTRFLRPTAVIAANRAHIGYEMKRLLVYGAAILGLLPALRSLRGLDLNQRPLGYEFCALGANEGASAA
jgi:hypothetical protein